VVNATWQRCRVHSIRNALAHAGKSGRRVVAASIATAFVQETPEAANTQWRAVADQISAKVPKLAAIMDEAEHHSGSTEAEPSATPPPGTRSPCRKPVDWFELTGPACGFSSA
jgi:transposase-like protein